MKINGISKEIELLWELVNIEIYYGIENLHNAILYLDRARECRDEVPQTISKAFCYGQIVEAMTRSLLMQSNIRMCIKNKKYNEIKLPETQDKCIKMLKRIGRNNDYKEFCELSLCMKKIRNSFAHELFTKDYKGLGERYKHMDSIYQQLYEIYAEADSQFLAFIENVLIMPEKILKKDASYSEDIKILEKYMDMVAYTCDVGDDKEKCIFSLRQILDYLKDRNKGGKSCNRLQLSFLALIRG